MDYSRTFPALLYFLREKHFCIYIYIYIYVHVFMSVSGVYMYIYIYIYAYIYLHIWFLRIQTSPLSRVGNWHPLVVQAWKSPRTLYGTSSAQVYVSRCSHRALAVPR